MHTVIGGQGPAPRSSATDAGTDADGLTTIERGLPMHHGPGRPRTPSGPLARI